MNPELFLKPLERKSWLHKVDPRVKLFFLIAFSFITILFESPGIQWSLLGFSLVLFFSTGADGSAFKGYFLVFYPLTLLLIGLAQGFFYPGARGEGLFSWDGFVYGLIQALRVLAIATASLAILLSTSYTSLLYSLGRMGLPQELCLIAALTFRLVPVIFQEIHLNLLAQRARGIDLRRISFFQKLQTLLRAGENVFLNSIHSVRDIALAVDLKAFRAYPQRTFTNIEAMNTLSWWVLALVSGGTLTAALLYSMGWGRYLI
jgi:energy-coupling factor transport system permease protein